MKLASGYEVLTMLKKYTTSCEDFPVHTYGKVIMCGDSGAGKSTLTEVRHTWCIDIFTVYSVITDTLFKRTSHRESMLYIEIRGGGGTETRFQVGETV